MPRYRVILSVTSSLAAIEGEIIINAGSQEEAASLAIKDRHRAAWELSAPAEAFTTVEVEEICKSDLEL